MLDPNYLLHISEGAENIAEKLHTDIISRIVERMMLRIGRGEDYLLTAQDKWQIENLQQAGYLLEDIQKDIADATRIQQSEIAEAMEDAGVKALAYDDKIYRETGLSPTPLTQSPELIRLMQRNYEATLHEWSNFTRTTADKVQQLFLSELDHAYHLVSTGALSYSAAVKEVINTVVSDGVKVTYPTGRSDTIETATLRAVRTGISQATAQIQTARMDEMDVDLVITSSHLGARPSHQVWQGKVFSRSGRSAKYPDFIQSTGYGSVSGLCGANCRHSFSPYFEGMDNPFEKFDSEENVKQYEKEQRQRVLERRIRDTKREVMGWKKAIDKCENDDIRDVLDKEYQRKALLLKNQNKVYYDYCADNNLRPLADRLEIAKWDRKQAAVARGAAQRYENMKMASDVGGIDWGPKGEKITNEQFKELMQYARESKIELSGFRTYDGNINSIKELIDDAQSVVSEYPGILEGKKKFTIVLDSTMSSCDFAKTNGHIVAINANAYRDVKRLEEEYRKLVKDGWFVKGTNYHAIIKHEIGHVVANKYSLNGLTVAKEVTGIEKKAILQEYLEKNISEYAASYADGREIISECFASVYGSEISNELALNILEKCANLILKSKEVFE